MFKAIRVFLLLLVLFFIGLNTWQTMIRTTDWNDPLWVTIYPINAAGNNKVQEYIDRLSVDDFDSLESFIAEQGAAYDLPLNQPIEVNLGRQLKEIPDSPPANAGKLDAIIWSLRFRYWAWRMKQTKSDAITNIRLFVLYHDPETMPRLAHSAGMQKGLIGLINAYGDWQYKGSNQVVIAHEMLHTVGASDKYDFSNGQPIHPHGYAEPERTPLYPQRYAELMGGRIPKNADESDIPRSLKKVRIGPETAREINWISQ
ncbi:hypothetical protein GCM10023116_49520 [Kistimonas scapharcae]|uniref:Uncharacterized protein n=1 Tax=Kistimonas scapharcae TaxID=1036133 RepID=A0ABP8V8S8_9GAMM